MNKTLYEELLNEIVDTGCTYADIYKQRSRRKIYSLIDSKIDAIKVLNKEGIGLRSILNNHSRYIATNDLSISNLKEQAKSLKANYNGKRVLESISLKEEVRDSIINAKIKHDDYATEKKINLLKRIDEIARKESFLVSQVSISIIEEDNDFEVANTKGKLIKSSYVNTRVLLRVYVKKDDTQEYMYERIGSGKGYEFLDEENIEEFVKNAVRDVLQKLDASTIKGGEYSVILEHGFGAVIFHEACGHGLEATSVAPKVSCFTGLLGKQIASPKVTLIDDGTIKNAWGSMNVDDEGNAPQKNILIENGVLKSYMVDYLNEEVMKHYLTGNARRQDYTFEPTSRMTNTYIEKGTDKVSDMIKSIDYGIYCKKMGSGLVNTTSGEFNFSVDLAYLIENGKLSKPLKDLCLIGTGKEVLQRVEMVSDDLVIEDGYCGSESGTVFVTTGQPTIKVSKMMVGGKDE